MSGVAASTARGVKWGGASQVTAQVVQLSSLVVLARLLVPEQFGLVAIVTTFVFFALLFTQLGIDAFVVHAPELRQTDLATAFWVNAGAGLMLTVVFALTAPLLADAFDQPGLAPLFTVASLTFVCSLGMVHLGLLQRDMRFAAIAVVEPSATVLTAVMSISLAVLGVGAMSLVIASVAAAAWKTIVLWFLARWRPAVRPSRASLRALRSYSGSLFLFTVVNYWGRNADNLLLGAVAGPAPLALYSRAYNLMLIPVQQSTQVLGRVLFPALVRLRDEPTRLRKGYLRALRVLAAVTFPLAIGLAVTSPTVVEVVLGPRWTGTAMLLTILALSGPAQIVSGTTGALYQALGRTDLLLRYGLGATVVTIAAMLVGLRWGATGVATAVSASYTVLMPAVTRPVWRLIGLRSRDAFSGLVPVALATALMAAVVLALRLAIDGHDLPALPALLVQVLAGAVVYGLLLRLLVPDVFAELRGIAGGRRRGAPAMRT